MPLLEARDPDAARQLDALLERVARGDRDAFQLLYQRSAGRLLAICLRLLREREDAEEVLQEVYVAAWYKAVQFDASKGSAMTWLSMLARNRAIDRLRAAPARPLLDISIADELPDEQPQPNQVAEQLDDNQRLQQCLQALEPRRRSLIRAAFLDGASHEELAQRLAAPLGTVKSWIRRGLGQLKVCLER